jgi:hypothetical protein
MYQRGFTMNYLNQQVTIGTDPIIILIDRQGLNTKRRAYVINNISTGGQIISLAMGQPAEANHGVVLSVGGSYDKSPNENPEQVAIYAVSSVAGGLVSIYEESE